MSQKIYIFERPGLTVFQTFKNIDFQRSLGNFCPSYFTEKQFYVFVVACHSTSMPNTP